MCLFSGRICDGIMEATKQKKTEQELAQEEKVTYMTTAPVRKLVCKLAVPTIISMLVTSFIIWQILFSLESSIRVPLLPLGLSFRSWRLSRRLDFSSGMVQETIFRESWERENMKRRPLWRQLDLSMPFYVVFLLL